MNKKPRGRRFTDRKDNLSQLAAICQKFQKTLRHGLNASANLKKATATYSSMIPSEGKDAADIIGISFILDHCNLNQYIYHGI